MRTHFPNTRQFLVFFVILFASGTSLLAQPTVYTFNYTGSAQNWTVPPCVTSITVTLKGGKGGGSSGGNGATVSGVMAVTPGQVLQIKVGGQGNCPGGTTYGGGGSAPNSSIAGYAGCSGGGASSILVAPYTNASAVAVAAGGGGKGGGDMGGTGGTGGCGNGGNGTSPFGIGGGGGSQTAGGSGGPPWTAGGGSGTNGSQMQGGNGGVDLNFGKAPGGGGGGGWYGGGGGGSDNINANSAIGGGGGGGGSSLTPAGWNCASGNNAGPGQVTISALVVTPTLAVNSATICQGLSAVLTATGGTTYTWQPGGMTTNPVTVTPAATTIYSVTTGVGACAVTKTTQVVVNPLPTPTVTSNSPVCVTKTINLTALGGTTYTWTGPGGYNSTTQNPSISPAQTTHSGTYTVTVKSAAGCIKTATVMVVVNPLPTITVNNPTLCVNQTIALTANGGTAYAWTGPAGFSSSAQNPNIPNATTSSAGNYQVIGTSAAGCTNVATSTVTILPLPTPSITSNSPVCAGQTLSFTGSGGGTYSWTGPNTFNSTAQNPSISNVTTAASGTYSLIVTLNTCTNIVTSPVTINPLPNPVANSNSPVCLNQPLNLTGSGGTTYTWTGPSSFSSNSQNPSISTATAGNAGVYTLSVTNVNGCVNFTTTNVVINSLPVITVNNPTACVNTNISLSATGGTAYAWTGPNGFVSTAQNPVIPNASTLMTGAYNVTVTSAQGCTASATASVTVITLPVPSITSNTPCVGATLNLSGGGGTTYTWTGPAGFSSTNQNPSISNVSLGANGIYTLVVSAGSCTNSITQSVTVNALPTPTAGNNTPICAGSAVNFSGSASTSYTWSGPGAFTSNSQNPSIPSASATASGIYTLSVTNANGCINSATTSVTVNPIPVPTIGSNNPVCVNNTINLTSGGGTTYSWSGPNGFTSALQNPSVANAGTVNAGVYSVTVTALGCSNFTTVSVSVLTPTVTASNTGPYCLGFPIQLNSSSASTFTWTGPGGFTSNQQNPTTAASTAGMAGTYNLIVSIGSCTAASSTSVTINALPTPTASNSSPICDGSTLNLFGSSAVSYTWSGPSSFSSNSQNPSITSASTTASGIYTITVTDVNGCVNFATTNVTVNPIPVPQIGSNSPVCLNNAINLTSGGGTSYSWSGPNGFTSTLQNPSVANAGTVNAGVYSVTVTALGCSNFTTVSVSVLTPTTNASNTGPYCVNDNIQLNTLAASSYTWSGPGGFSSNLQNPLISSATTAMSGVYNLIVSIGSCTAATSTSVTVNALPTPTASNNSPICDGSILNLFGSSAVSYTWSGPSSFSSNSQNPSITSASTTASGIYTITVTDGNGCVNFATTNVTVNPIPVPQIGSNSPVCLNNAINLTSGGGTSYSWSGPNGFSSTLQNPSVAVAGTVDAGVYSVTVTSLGCSNFTTVSVSVLTPTTNASNTGPYCVNDNIQLNTLTASSYTWSGPAGFSSNQQNPLINSATVAMGGVYNLIASIGSCTAAASTTVVVNALPTPTASNNSAICDGTTLNLFGSSAVSYTWTGPLSFASNSQNPSITNATTTASGLYTITVTDVNGCVNFATTNVTVNPIPVPQIGSNSPVCLNNSINLTSGGGTSYAWSGPNGFTSGTQNPTVPGATTVNDGVYTVTVTALGCSNTATVNVSILTPTIAASNTGPYCAGAPIQLNTSSVTSYTWSGPGGFSSNAQNPSIAASTTGMSGVYNLLASIGSCTASASTSVTVNPLPSPLIISNSPVCEGTTITMAGTGGATYLWAGPSGFGGAVQASSVPSANMSNAGMYTLTVTDANGCINSTTYSVTVNPLPNAVAVGTTVCQNANAILTASGGNSYSWSGPNNFNAIGASATIPSAPLNSSGQYTVTVTSVYGCTSTAMANLNIVAAPTPSIQSNSPVCINGSINLTTQAGYNYAWTGPGGFISSVQNPSLAATTTALSGMYYLTMTDANNCSASTNVNVVVNPLPVPVISSTNKIGCAPLCVNFNVQSATQVSSAAWSLGNGSTGSGSTVSACYSAQGVHTVNASVTDANGCFNSATYTVQVTPQPIADFNFSPLKPIVNVDADVLFTDASHGNNITSWTWYFMNTSGAQSVQQNTHFLYENPGEYVVALVVKNEFGCTDTMLKPITVSEDFGIYVPNAFTPNGDGVNDTFQPKGFGIEKYEMQIYDRWGEKVFETTEFEKGWDGSYMKRSETSSKDDSYIWRIKATSVFGKAHEYTGHVTLIK